MNKLSKMERKALLLKRILNDCKEINSGNLIVDISKKRIIKHEFNNKTHTIKLISKNTFFIIEINLNHNIKVEFDDEGYWITKYYNNKYDNITLIK